MTVRGSSPIGLAFGLAVVTVLFVAVNPAERVDPLELWLALAMYASGWLSRGLWPVTKGMEP
jgi:hypothetical protein